MKSIKFSESELEFLQNHYELELLDAENYVGEIKNILNKLGKIEKEKEVTGEKSSRKTGKKRGRPKNAQKGSADVTESTQEKPAKTVKPSVKKGNEPKAAKPKGIVVKAEKEPVVKSTPKKVIKKAKAVTAAKKIVKKAPKTAKALAASTVAEETKSV
jgi:hypothetical protein